MGAKRLGPKLTPNTIKCYRYQRAIVDKVCIECGSLARVQRNMIAICSDNCRTSRRRKARPATYRVCPVCSVKFGPIDHLKRKTCSPKCRVKFLSGRKSKQIQTPEARRASKAIRYELSMGRMVRPTRCEECRKECKPEAAHFNYTERLRVRWLCVSCHRKWDKAKPKRGTIKIPLDRWAKYTGKDPVREDGTAWSKLK